MRPGWITLSLICLSCGTDSAPSRLAATPLRRLSNTEYLYALHDLFPNVDARLPPLPADTSASGFDNEVAAQAPSDVRIARYETIGNLYGSALTSGDAAVRGITGCADWSTPTLAAACSAGFIDRLGGKLFRRPLTTDERDHFNQRFIGWQAAVDFPGAVQLTISAMLQAPQFLYRPEPIDASAGGDASGDAIAPVEPYAMASRLSFFLWESVPDDELLRAAGRDQLRTEDDLRRQAARMLADPRALRVTWDFHRQWLTLDRILGEEHAVRTPEVDPMWTASTQQSALLESRLLVEHTGSLDQLLTSRRAWVDHELARVYGVPGPAGQGWISTELPADQRAGVLTRVAFLAGYSHRAATSPPIRGNGVMLQLLCQLPAPPPADADLSMPVATPGDGPKTNRTLFEERTAPVACQGCHHALNGFGFGFENYTASGAFITEQVGLPIDPSGAIVGTDVDGPFANARELSDRLAHSDVVYRCATRRWVQFALGRLPLADEPELVDQLADRFIATNGDFHTLLTSIVTSPMFRLRRLP